jgi:hypothetical protein
MPFIDEFHLSKTEKTRPAAGSAEDGGWKVDPTVTIYGATSFWFTDSCCWPITD